MDTKPGIVEGRGERSGRTGRKTRSLDVLQPVRRRGDSSFWVTNRLCLPRKVLRRKTRSAVSRPRHESQTFRPSSRSATYAVLRRGHCAVFVLPQNILRTASTFLHHVIVVVMSLATERGAEGYSARA